VRGGLAEADWTIRRDLIRALVKRVAIGEQEVQVVLRIGPGPPELAAQIMQRCTGSNDAALRDPAQRAVVLPILHIPGLQ